ncbi:MAG: sugar phosphate isomerase/epimerase, partial [Myxococcales bacterium]|nr:sugar phosphate isomerase/epimerase [Myxococcales bacterium]
MARTRNRPVYFSFFMFDANTRLWSQSARARYLEHMKVLADQGYAGFELHCGRSPEYDVAFPTYAAEVDGYAELRAQMDQAGLKQIALATNVGQGPDQDLSSPDPAQQEAGIAFLKSRIDINGALRAKIMMGPMVIPYGAFVHRAPNGDGVWSDALQDELAPRYETAAANLQIVGEYAEERQVKLAIEPITHWETPGPNTLQQLMAFLERVPSSQVGVVIDSAHETL